jgi:hypothetical protein
MDPAGHPRAARRGRGPGAGLPLGYATIGLVLTLRRPANPIGWLYAASGLVWALVRQAMAARHVGRRVPGPPAGSLAVAARLLPENLIVHSRCSRPGVNTRPELYL